MAKAGDPNHGPGPVLPIYPDPDDTQPTKAVGEITQQIKAVRAETPESEKKPTDSKKPTFGFGSLVLLIVLIWGAEWIGQLYRALLTICSTKQPPLFSLA